MILNKIYNPNTFDAGYKLYTEQRTGLMKIRNWLVTRDEMWSLQIFDTIWARSVKFNRELVLDTINEVINDNFYTEEQKEILNALRDEYIHVSI